MFLLLLLYILVVDSHLVDDATLYFMLARDSHSATTTKNIKKTKSKSKISTFSVD